MIYTISDLHLPSTINKTMNRFGWGNHVEKLEKNWNLSDDDTVILCGDLSWALYEYEVIPDLDWLENLSGKKIILKGNHDLWWNSTKKLNQLLENYPSISYIHNNSIEIDDISICGTRGWDIMIKDKHDEKILKREAIRLQESLKKASSSKKIVFFHYPPVLKNCSTDIFEKILKEYNVKQVYYGHLHGDNIENAIQEEYNGIYYKCIACDQIEFTPIPLTLN